MRFRFRRCPAALLLVFPLNAQVTTSQYDTARTGATLRETTLKPSNVNPRTFGRLFSLQVDGDVYAQPLYVPGVAIPGKGIHNVLFVATEGDSVYAFDADRSSAPLWHTRFARPGSAITTVPAQSIGCPFIEPQIGITATPIIDLAADTMYVLARTREQDSHGTWRFWQRLHALDIRSGAEKLGGPVVIGGSVNGPKEFFGLYQEEIHFSPFRETAKRVAAAPWERVRRLGLLLRCWTVSRMGDGLRCSKSQTDWDFQHIS